MVTSYSDNVFVSIVNEISHAVIDLSMNEPAQVTILPWNW